MKREISDWDQLINRLFKIKQWVYERRKLIYSGLFFYLFTAMQMLLFSEEKDIKSLIRTALVTFTLRQTQLVLNLIIIMLFSY